MPVSFFGSAFEFNLISKNPKAQKPRVFGAEIEGFFPSIKTLAGFFRLNQNQ
jgi:hypothetical protein